MDAADNDMSAAQRFGWPNEERSVLVRLAIVDVCLIEHDRADSSDLYVAFCWRASQFDKSDSAPVTHDLDFGHAVRIPARSVGPTLLP